MAKPLCPLLNKPCQEHKCKFWVHVDGHNPQTGEAMKRWDCTFALFPMIMLENSQMQRQTGAAVESLRNEVAAGAGSFMYAVMAKRLGGDGIPQLERKDDENPG